MNPALSRLWPYPFERLRELLAGAQPPAGLPHISLSIGEPRHRPPQFVLDTLASHLHALGSYPASAGLPEFRAAVANWLTRRFSLPAGAVNPDTMVLPANGTREALFAVVQALTDRDRNPIVVMPNPFYQIYEGAALLADAEPYFMGQGNAGAAPGIAHDIYGSLPDLDGVPESVWKRCQLLFLCSPGNPTGAVAGIDYLRRALELANRYDFVVASDECYSEIYFDEANPPTGLLQAALAAGHSQFERCLVFHSLSKRSSVPGLRSGFIAGDAALIKPFLLYRTYHGCAMPVHVQLASISAWNDDRHVVENRALYRDKFARVLPILREVLDVDMPQASFYLWPKVADDERFTRELFERQHVTTLPGSYIARDSEHGNPGRDRVRISLVATLEECVEAAERIRRYVRER
jgi:N-succinyldiaminopimelate aminotransferase